VFFGLPATGVVVMVDTEHPKGQQVISPKKAEKHEGRYYREITKENPSQG